MTINKIRNHFPWIKDIAMVFGMIAVLYLNLNYVTNSKFDAFVAANDVRLDAIQSTIISLDKSLALLQQNNIILTSLQLEVSRINKLQIEVIQQNIIDAAVNNEFHLLVPRVYSLENDVKQIEKLNLNIFLKESSAVHAEIDHRLKDLEKK